MTVEGVKKACRVCFPIAAAIIVAVVMFIGFVVLDPSPAILLQPPPAPPPEKPTISTADHPIGIYLSVPKTEPYLRPDGSIGKRIISDERDHPAAEIHLDDAPFLWLSYIYWKKLCPSEAPQYLIVGGHTFHLTKHPVAVPGQTGMVPELPKGRWIIDDHPVPLRQLSVGVTGDAEFWLHITSGCRFGQYQADTPHYKFKAVP